MITYEVEVHSSGGKYWYLNGKLHREDGPACESANGTKYWFLNGKELTEQEFLKAIQKEPEVITDLRQVAEQYGYKLVKE